MQRIRLRPSARDARVRESQLRYSVSLFVYASFVGARLRGRSLPDASTRTAHAVPAARRCAGRSQPARGASSRTALGRPRHAAARASEFLRFPSAANARVPSPFQSASGPSKQPCRRSLRITVASSCSYWFFFFFFVFILSRQFFLPVGFCRAVACN